MAKKQMNWHKISFISTIFLGIVLIALGAYFTSISISRISLADKIFNLKNGAKFSEFEINEIIDQQDAAAKLSNDGLFLQDLAFSELILSGQKSYFSKEGSELLHSAKSNLEKGLRLSPANSVAWLRLAYINMLIEGSSKNVSDAVYMSVVTAPYNYNMIYYRLSLAIITWDYFNEEDQNLLLQQVRIGWKWDKDQLFDLAKSDKAINIINRAFEFSNDDTLEFNKMLKNITNNSK